jgi:hypothetical protein
MIKVDCSTGVALAACTICHWTALRDTRGAAYNAGTFHQRGAHPADARGLRTVEELARRHRH